VTKLQQDGHETLAASPDSGVDTITGEGVAEALAGADAVIDAANAPAWDDEAVMNFFQTASRNLTKAAKDAGIKHYVAMSIVGADRLPDSGYLRAKVAQENLIKGSGIPYSILRSTQFFEFGKSIAQAGTIGNEVHISTGAFQPIASDEVV